MNARKLSGAKRKTKKRRDVVGELRDYLALLESGERLRLRTTTFIPQENGQFTRLIFNPYR
jgi:hypothetical protein